MIHKKKLGNILVTGGAGFIGSNLIKHIVTNYQFSKIVSIDNYYTGSKKKHIKHKKISYIKLDTRDINLTKNRLIYNFNPNYIFHFAEFSRVVPSFKYFEDCYNFNTQGTLNIILYAHKKKSKLIYSGSSSKFGNVKNENLSPYSWTKSKNIEIIKNFHNWFGLDFTIVYFFNVYGENQIKNHYMSAVIGIFEEQYLSNKELTVVKPGNQKRDFTHINDIVNGTLLAAIIGKRREYQIGSGKNYTLLEVAKMFECKIKFIKERQGERFTSLSNYKLAKKYLGYIPRYKLENYIKNFISKKNKK